jgi:hypothetical protein
MRAGQIANSKIRNPNLGLRRIRATDTAAIKLEIAAKERRERKDTEPDTAKVGSMNDSLTKTFIPWRLCGFA